MKRTFSLRLALFSIVILVNAKKVTIGEQVWSTKNLDVSTFRNGEAISHAKTDEEWILAGVNKQPAWCYYANDSIKGTKYGKLYNWYAVNDPRGIAPLGWHIPSDDEWSILQNNLGQDVVHKMKDSGGFNALPGESRNSNGEFNNIGKFAYWWSSIEDDAGYAQCRYVNYHFGNLFGGWVSKGLGLSVRCIED